MYAKVSPHLGSVTEQEPILIHFEQILEAYAVTIGEKKWNVVGGRLEEGEDFAPKSRVSSRSLRVTFLQFV